MSALVNGDSPMRDPVVIWNSCIFACRSFTSHPEHLAFVSGFQLNGVKLDVSLLFHMTQTLLKPTCSHSLWMTHV
jgi:hypothetical protein